MQKNDDIISYILKENIVDEKTLQRVLKKQQKISDESLVDILKKSNLVDESLPLAITATSEAVVRVFITSSV